VEDGGTPTRTGDGGEEANDERRAAAPRRVANGSLAVVLGVGSSGLSGSCELVMLWPAPGLPYRKARTREAVGSLDPSWTLGQTLSNSYWN
jgi:hypothetical protein